MSQQESLTVRMGITGQPAVVKGIDDVTRAEERLGRETERTGSKTRKLGADLRGADLAARATGASMDRLGAGVRFAARQATYGAAGLGALAVATTKWGLEQNAAVESARIRFGLFTDDVDGLMQQVRKIDKESAAFGLAPLADAAAMLGNAEVKNIPSVLRAAANAAAAGGKGAEGLQSIVLALSQIQSKGKVSQEEINQLNEAGAPGTQRIIQQAFGLTADQLGNLGAEGLDASKAIQALTTEWTSGRLADAAARQAKSLSGQWAALTSNAQTVAGAMTLDLANSLSKDVLPAANRAAEQINALFGDEGLSNEQRLRKARDVIRRELGPFAEDLKDKLDDADIPAHLGKAIGAAAPVMASAAAEAAPEVAKAFADAWMNSGPWVQIATLLFAGKKLTDAGRWAKGGKGGKGGGGLGGGPVTVTGGPITVIGAGQGAPVNPAGKPDKTPKWGRAVKNIGKFAGPVGGAIIAAEAIRAVDPNFGDNNNPTRGMAPAMRARQGTVPPPGFGGGPLGGGTTTVNVNVGEEQVARAVVRGDDHMANRTR